MQDDPVPPVSPAPPLPRRGASAKQLISKNVPQAIIEDYFQELARKAANKFKIISKKLSNGEVQCDVEKNGVEFSLQIHPKGNLSVSMEKTDDAGLKEMIKLLAEGIKKNGGSKEVTLTGTKKDIDIMKAACVVNGLKVYDPDQQQTTTLSTDPSQTDPVENNNVRITPMGRRQEE